MTISNIVDILIALASIVAAIASVATFIVAFKALRIWKAKKRADFGDELAITVHKIDTRLKMVRSLWQSHPPDVSEPQHKINTWYKDGFDGDIENALAKTKLYFPNVEKDLDGLMKTVNYIIKNLWLQIECGQNTPPINAEGLDLPSRLAGMTEVVYLTDEHNPITQKIDGHVDNIIKEVKDNLNR